MLYEFLFPLSGQFHVLNLFRYVTFRAVYAAVTAFIISLLAGPVLIRFLRRVKAGQSVRDDGPQTHLKKQGTPTMGGVLMLWSVVLSSLLWVRLDNRYIWIALASVVWFGGVGFIDDYQKLVYKNSKGSSARHKLLLQGLGAAGVVAAYILTAPADFSMTTLFNVPFLKHPIMLPVWVFAPIGITVIVGASNAVNLTDGLDGLAIGTASFVSMTFAVLVYLVGHAKISAYLLIPHVPELAELAVVCAALLGTCLGFLWFNAHPAEVFMGDTGSLMLGGFFGTVAVLAKQELMLALVGGIYVVEALSVIIQVAGFRATGKRIFAMAPIHHHFELKGLPESKVIVRFWIVAALLMLAALSTLKLR
ncbi:MAG: phospho-N-acetylmuramoyl-pentapeptide-transferase [candidate division FCPU426 bacterium]